MYSETDSRTYTVEELLERAEEGRRQIALGNYTDIEDVLRELELTFGIAAASRRNRPSRP